jgi:hypothetical protein
MQLTANRMIVSPGEIKKSHKIIAGWQRKYFLVSRKEKLWDARSIRGIGPQDGNPVSHI